MTFFLIEVCSCQFCNFCDRLLSILLEITQLSFSFLLASELVLCTEHVSLTYSLAIIIFNKQSILLTFPKILCLSLRCPVGGDKL